MAALMAHFTTKFLNISMCLDILTVDIEDLYLLYKNNTDLLLHVMGPLS